MVRAFDLSLLLFALFAPSVLGNGAFLKAHDEKVRKRQFVEEVYVSLFTHVQPHDVISVSDQIGQRFKAMPKNTNGGIQSSPLHYLAHSYFLRQHGWLVRGLDPHRLSTYNASAKVFERDDFAGYLEHFVGTVVNDTGFNLEFTAAFMVVLKDFVISEGVERLEDAYRLNGMSHEFMISRERMQIILDSYLAFASNYASRAHDPVEHRRDLQSFFNNSSSTQSHMLAQDVLQTAAFQYMPRANPFSAERWSFQQATGLVTQLSRQYGDMRELECQELKGALVDMDPTGTGRVPLGRFYSQKAVGRWRLGESVEYLRQLGALDESVPGLAPHLIIPNYVTAVSNCESVSMYYSLCCIHECENILGHFEMHIKKATASPSEILALVPSASESAPRNVSRALVDALEQVASVHEGQVPLYGRLFAQWLHYLFPQDCPYPHMSQTFRPLTPSEWIEEHGKDVAASHIEVDKYVQDELDAALRKDSPVNVSDAMELSQWTLEEEMSWELRDKENPTISAEARLINAKTFAMVLIMSAVFAYVVGGELRRGYQVLFKKDRGLKEVGLDI